jgi:hypothetical protein
MERNCVEFISRARKKRERVLSSSNLKANEKKYLEHENEMK